MGANMLIELVYLSLATATVSVTVSQTEIFKPVRDYVNNKIKWLHYLVTCSYCMCHWVAGALVLVTSYGKLSIPEGVVVWLAVTGGAALVSGTIGKLYE